MVVAGIDHCTLAQGKQLAATRQAASGSQQNKAFPFFHANSNHALHCRFVAVCCPEIVSKLSLVPSIIVSCHMIFFPLSLRATR